MLKSCICKRKSIPQYTKRDKRQNEILRNKPQSYLTITHDTIRNHEWFVNLLHRERKAEPKKNDNDIDFRKSIQFDRKCKTCSVIS